MFSCFFQEDKVFSSVSLFFSRDFLGFSKNRQAALCFFLFGFFRQVVG